MIGLKLIGPVLNKRKLVPYKTNKHDERVVLFFVEKQNERKLKNSVVIQNVTQDLSICSEHLSLTLSQIAMKF